LGLAVDALDRVADASCPNTLVNDDSFSITAQTSETGTLERRASAMMMSS